MPKLWDFYHCVRLLSAVAGVEDHGSSKDKDLPALMEVGVQSLRVLSSYASSEAKWAGKQESRHP